jgi:hypothetical protein
MSAISDFCTNFLAKLPKPVSVEIVGLPKSATLVAWGDTVQCALNARLPDGSCRNVLGQISWSSSAPDVVAIDRTGRVYPRDLGSATITATFFELSASSVITVTGGAGRLQALKIKPQDYAAVGGGDLDFSVVGTFTDGSTILIQSDQLVWSSSAPKIASIDQAGHATFQSAGMAMITAKDKKTGIHCAAKVTVVAPGAGARKINVQVMLKNFKDEPMSDYYAQGECASSGAQPITLWGLEIKGGVVEWPSQLLMPDGIVTINLIPRSEADAVPHGVAHYKLPTSGIMTFSAVQKAETKRTTAATKEEAIQKVGAQVTAGAPMEVVELGGNEWEITWGTDTLDLKQI